MSELIRSLPFEPAALIDCPLKLNKLSLRAVWYWKGGEPKASNQERILWAILIRVPEIKILGWSPTSNSHCPLMLDSEERVYHILPDIRTVQWVWSYRSDLLGGLDPIWANEVVYHLYCITACVISHYFLQGLKCGNCSCSHVWLQQRWFLLC